MTRWYMVAGAPAYRVPRAAIEAIFDVQTLATVAPKGADGRPDLGAALMRGRFPSWNTRPVEPLLSAAIQSKHSTQLCRLAQLLG
jgi:hypothetical protein